MPAIGKPLFERISTAEFERRRSSVAPWILRPAAPADLEQLAQIEPVLFPDEAWDKQMLREEITHADRSYVVAVEAGENPSDGAKLKPAFEPTDTATPILGYAGIMKLGEIADLHTIGTLREGAGIGQAMLNWCIAEAKTAGCKQLLLEVRVDNERAVAFYERAGFEALGIRKNYYHTPSGKLDALVMVKELFS